VSRDVILLVMLPVNYNTGEADDSHALLDLHRLKNKSSKPPNPQGLLCSPTSRESEVVSHHSGVRCRADNSRHANGPHHGDDPHHANRPQPADDPRRANGPQRTSDLHHANTRRTDGHYVVGTHRADVPHHADSSHHTKTRNPNLRSPQWDTRQVLNPNSEASRSEENSNSESDSKSVRVCAHRNSKSQKEPTSSQLGFYDSHTTVVLNLAKSYQRLAIHVNEPFPERNEKTLKQCNELVLEAFTTYIEENQNVELDHRQWLFTVSHPS
jgi:hypothetical protein